jgi:DNA modification methylase
MGTLQQTHRLSVEYVAVDQVKPHARNARTHSKKQVRQIADSISEFGFDFPVLIDKSNLLIAGHGRLEAAKLLRMAEIPAVRVEHLSEKQVLALAIADNKLTENGDWNKQLLAENFKFLLENDIDFSLEVSGFEMEEIQVFVDGLQGVGNNDGEHDAIEDAADGPVVTKTGDLWLLGPHRVYCGDSLDEASFTALMEGRLARIVFTDPPYNLSVNEISGLGQIQHRNFVMAAGEMTEEEFCHFLLRDFRLLANHSMNGALHYICMDWRHVFEILKSAKQVYSEFKNLCVWAKNSGGMGSLYRSQHELIFVFKHGNAAHQNNVQLGQFGRYRTNLWQYPGVNSFARNCDEGNLLRFHPTVKPIAMVADALLDASQRNEIVLDSFLGSGTTLLAAERTGRVCHGIEIDSRYVDTAIRRWQKLTGKNARHAVSGRNFNELEQEAAHVIA